MSAIECRAAPSTVHCDAGRWRVREGGKIFGSVSAADVLTALEGQTGETLDKKAGAVYFSTWKPQRPPPAPPPHPLPPPSPSSPSSPSSCPSSSSPSSSSPSSSPSTSVSPPPPPPPHPLRANRQPLFHSIQPTYPTKSADVKPKSGRVLRPCEQAKVAAGALR